MPNENKKRGRREDKKRKLEASDELQNRKRRKSEGETGAPPAQDQEQAEFRQYEDEHPHEQVFFGMLEEQEQEYFKRADEMLELNQFADDEGDSPSCFLDNRSTIVSAHIRPHRAGFVPRKSIQRVGWEGAEDSMQSIVLAAHGTTHTLVLLGTIEDTFSKVQRTVSFTTRSPSACKSDYT